MIMMRMAVLKNTKTFVALLSRLLLLSAAAVDVSAQTTPPVVRYMCDNCIDRSKYTVRAIVHGTKDDPYWQQLQASAVQAAKDMQVGLEMTLYDPQSSAEAIATQMAEDIQAAIDANPRPNGLIVSIPFEEVASAVQQAVAAGIPVFGVNGDSVTGADTGVLDFIASDHKIGGTLAAEEMIKSGASSNFLFVNYQGEGNFINAERYAGFSQAIQGSNETTAPVDVNEIVVDANADAAVIQEALVTAMTSSTSSSCPAVLLSGKNILQSAIAAHAEAGCSSLITTTSPLGTFETSQEVYNAIDAGQLSFAVAEQQALQGSLAMILAALYVTTGKTLSASTEVEGGAYLTGPIIINKNTTMSDSQKTCEVDAFPICPNNKALDGSTTSKCDCTDRSKLKIGGVTHGVTTDVFWDPVYKASAQAALDMGVELFNEPFEPEQDETVLYNKMANRITALCEQQGVDGLFVSIPSDIVEPAIQTCLDLGIPVMSINAGAEASQRMGLAHHIGMIEDSAGYAAGVKLAATGIDKAVCINHAEGVNVVTERCAGFKRAVEEKGITFIGEAFVPADDMNKYIEIVEEMVGETGDWTGYGLLAAGSPQHVPVLALQAKHTDVKIGSFDTSSELYEAVDIGIQEFGMDQQPYLQGYVPVVLLTLAASTKQQILNGVIESGPAFIEASPSEAQESCEVKMFETCAAEAGDASSPKSSSTTTNNNNTSTGLIAGLSVVAVVFFLAFVFVGYRMNKLSAHVRELESRGVQVPSLSMRQRLSSSVRPVSEIVTEGETA